MRWQISQRVTGSWETVTGKRREFELLIWPGPAGVVVPYASVQGAPPGMSGKSVELHRCCHLQWPRPANLAVRAGTGCPCDGVQEGQEVDPVQPPVQVPERGM